MMKDGATGQHGSTRGSAFVVTLRSLAKTLKSPFSAARWAAVCVEGLESSQDRRTSSRSRFMKALNSERAAFVFMSTSRLLPPLTEDYGALK